MAGNLVVGVLVWVVQEENLAVETLTETIGVGNLMAAEAPN